MNDDQVKKPSGQVQSIFDQSVTGKVVGAFTQEAKLNAVEMEELTDVDDSLLGYREGKKSKWRTARPEWDPIQHATRGMKYTSKNGNVYRWDDIATLMQEGEDEGTSYFMKVMGFPGAVVEFGYDHTIGLMEDQPDPLPEGMSDFYGIIRDAGGPEDVDRRVQRYIDDMEDWEAIFAQGEVAGVAKAFGMGFADPIELAITGLTLGTSKLAKGKVPLLENVDDAAKFHKALRRLRRIQDSGARLTPQQAALLAPLMRKAPSTYQKLRRVVLPALFEGGISYAIESAVDDQLTSEDLLKVAGTAAMFAGSLSYTGRKANQFYGSANRLYNNLVDESMSERLEGIAEEAGVPFKISTREEEIATALHLADIDAVDFEVAFKDLMRNIQHEEDFIKSMQTAGVIKFTQPASVDLSSSTNARMLAWFLFQRNLMTEGSTGVDFAATVSDLLAHNKRVIHFELSELFEEAGVPMGVRGAVSSKINPEEAKNSERYLEAVYRSLDEEDFLDTYEIDLPEDQIDIPEDGSPPVTTKTVNVFTDPNSEYFGLDEAKVKKRAGRIRDRIFDYEGHHLGLAERVEHYFPRTGRVAEYVNDKERQAKFKERFVAYVTKREPDMDPAEADKLAEEALQSIKNSTNKRVVMPEWTVDSDGQIVRPHEVDGVSVPGEARERNIDIPLYVMRDFYQDGNVNMFRSTLPRQSNVFAAQELLKLNPKGSAESLPKVIDEADLPEVPEGQPPVDYNEDFHDIKLGQVARRSGVEDVTSFIEENKPLIDDVRRQDSEIKTLKDENEQLKQTNRDLKVEEGAIVDTAESKAEQAVDQYSEGLDRFFELDELQDVSKDDVASQLSKLQPRLEKLLRDQQRELDSGELRAVTDLEYGKEKLIDEKTEITKGVNKKNIKAQEKLSKNLESKKSEEFVLSKLVQVFQYRTGDKSVLTFGPEGSFVVIDPSGYKAKDFEADLNWLANEYFPGQADSLSKMKAFIKNDPEKLLAKYSEQLTKKIGERVEAQKAFDDFKPEEYSPEVSARVAEIDSLLGQIESQQELPVHRRKAWNSSKANLRAAKIKDLRSSIKVLKSFLEDPNSVDLDAADLQNIQVKVKGQTGRVPLRDAVAIVSEAFNEQQRINLDDLEYYADKLIEDAVVTRNTSSRRAGDEIDESVRHNQRERLLNISKMKDNTLRRKVTELERKDANEQVRNTLGFSVKKGEISLRDRNNLAIEANKEFVNSSLSLGIINDGGSYRFTDQGWGGRIKREFEELIDNAEGDDKIRLEEEMELTAYLIGRMRDNMLGMGQTSSYDGFRKLNAMGAQWLTLPNISKNSSMDLANLMVKRKGNEAIVSLAKSLTEAIKEKLPVGQDLNETTIVKIHEASVLELMDRDSGTSSRAFMLSEEGGSAYTKEAPQGTDITGQAWKRVSGFKYVQPFLRGVIARVYEDHILGIGEKLYWGEDLSVDDLRDLKKFSLNPDRAKKIYAEWTRTHSPENHISPNGQLKLFVNVEDMDPDLRNDFERAVNTATSSVHLEPRFEDTMVTKPNEGGGINAEIEMIANTIQGFGHAAARKWRMPGTQLLHELRQDPLSKRTSEYALGTAAALATMVAIESLYYTAQEYALEQVGTEQAMGKKRDRSAGQLLLDTFLKSGYGGGPASLFEKARYFPAAFKGDSSYERFIEEKNVAAAVLGIGAPGIAGAVSMGMDIGYMSKDTLEQLTSHKKSKREFATDLRKQGLRGSLTPAHIMLVEMLDIAGAFTKEEIISPHIELKTPSLRVRED